MAAGLMAGRLLVGNVSGQGERVDRIRSPTQLSQQVRLQSVDDPTGSGPQPASKSFQGRLTWLPPLVMLGAGRSLRPQFQLVGKRGEPMPEHQEGRAPRKRSPAPRAHETPNREPATDGVADARNLSPFAMVPAPVPDPCRLTPIWALTRLPDAMPLSPRHSLKVPLASPPDPKYDRVSVQVAFCDESSILHRRGQFMPLFHSRRLVATT